MICVIIVVVAADHLPHQLAEEQSYQDIKAIRDRESAELWARIEDYRRRSIHICCDCGFWEGWYTTPGRAKMALSGHQKSCRRNRDAKTSQQA